MIEPRKGDVIEYRIGAYGRTERHEVVRGLRDGYVIARHESGTLGVTLSEIVRVISCR